MAKKGPKTVFVCSECGYESPKWMGQCICGAWNTFTEEKVPNDTGVKSLTEGPSGYPLTVLRATSSWWSPELHTVDGGLLLYESSFHLYKARWFVDNPFSYKYE